MNHHFFKMLICFWLNIGPLYGQYYRSPVSEAALVNIELKSETGADTSLFEMMQDTSKPIVLIPGYFNCNSTCPLMAKNLKTILDDSELKDSFQMIFLSFHIGEDEEAMSRFRSRHQLDKNWKLAVVKKEEDAKTLMNPFGYQFQKAAQEFDHPNSAYIFSPKKKIWTGMFVRNDNTVKDLYLAVGQAELADRSDWLAVVQNLLQKPAYVIVVALPGLILSLAMIIFLVFRRKKRVKGKE